MSDNLGPMTDLGFPHDHATISWEHFLAQHIGKSNTESFVRAFYNPLKALDDTLKELYNERGIDTATGDALNGIGSIVGVNRISAQPVYLEFFGFDSQPAGRAFGVARMRKYYEPYTTTSLLPDEEYRTAIKLKIALNNGHGTAEEIMYAFDTALNIKGTQVYDMGNANGQILIPKIIANTDPEYYLITSLIPGAAGVKWHITFLGAIVFGFSNYPNFYGFGKGVMATSLVKETTSVSEDVLV